MKSAHPNSPSSEDPLKPCPVDGAWESLDLFEVEAQVRIAEHLKSFHEPFTLMYGVGLLVPMLRPNERAVVDLRCAGPFLKRALNDLRAVWILLNAGYSSQAAAVTASLYENAMATVCLTMSQANVDALRKSESGELPWGVMDMVKMVIRGEIEKGRATDYEDYWRSLYAHYVWLCQCKHPTMQSVLYDTLATKSAESYVIAAFPNADESDIPFKTSIAVQALIRAYESIRAFADGLGYAGSYPEEHDFARRLKKARDLSWRAFGPHLKAKHPISIFRTRFARKYPPSSSK